MDGDHRRASHHRPRRAGKEKAELKSKLETEWDTFAKANYAKPRGLAEQAAAMVWRPASHVEEAVPEDQDLEGQRGLQGGPGQVGLPGGQGGRSGTFPV